MAPLRVTLMGYFGRGNVGDEALLSCSLEAVRARAPDAEIVVLAFDPVRVSRDFGVPAVPAHGFAGRWARWRRLAASDLVLIGGGGLLKDWGRDSANMSIFCRPALWARLCGNRTAFCGVGVGPVRHPMSRRWLAHASRRASVVWVRDEASREWIRKCGGDSDRVRVAPDPAFAFEPAAPEEVTRWLSGFLPAGDGRPLWVVNLRHWYQSEFRTSADERRLMDFLAGRLVSTLRRAQAEEGAAVLLLPFRTESFDDDREALGPLLAGLPGEAVALASELPSPAVLRGILAHAAFSVSMRLHASIFAASAAVPFVALAYEEKVDGTLGMLGLSDAGVRLTEDGIAGLEDRVWRTWNGRRERSEHLASRMLKIRPEITDAWDEVFRPFGVAPIGGGSR